MNQESTQNSDPQSAPGALLKAAKVKANFSSEQVASRLNLTVELIESIETDDYQASVSPAFYRGYLRSYAQLVKIDADHLIELYNGIIHQDSLSATITPTFDTNLYTKKDRQYPYLKWFLYLIVTASILIAGYYIWNKKFNSNDLNESEISLITDSTSSQTEIPLTGLELDDTEQPDPAPLKDEDTDTTTLPAKPTVRQITASNALTSSPAVIESAILQMSFSGDCWVKVTDTKGEVLAIGIKRTGKSMSLEGMAPFTVILGNAGAVTISYNQLDVDLSGFPSGNRVELQISADSELIQ